MSGSSWTYSRLHFMLVFDVVAMLITCSITNCSTGQKLCIHIQCEVNTNSAHILLPITGIIVKQVKTWSVKSTLFHLGGWQHTSFHLSNFKFHKNALAMFSPEFPYQMKEIIWNLLTEACTMHCQKPCTWHQRATSFTHKVLSPTSMTDNTHYKEAKCNMQCGMHMFESNPGD
jgi:hypothetical protein